MRYLPTRFTLPENSKLYKHTLKKERRQTSTKEIPITKETGSQWADKSNYQELALFVP